MDYYKLAVLNIAMHGDTDIFPFPIENAMFFDNPDKICQLLKDIDSHFEQWLAKYPVECIRTCIPVGYTGYRWATMIDPLWNSYLLYLVIKIAEKLESTRVSSLRKNVFSYRVKIDKKKNLLFNPDINWRLYYQTAINISEQEPFTYIVRFDITDFYNRIYHHRLENALVRSGVMGNEKKRIMTILQDISGNVSYGLPIGGNAARILAEILLNSIDQMMVSKSYRFCRYVDDFIIFANSKEDAFKKLNWCADFLLRNEGLCLQKSKTQIQSKSEFLTHAKTLLEGQDDSGAKERAEFLRIHIHYDPYSATPEEDYRKLKRKIEQFDIISLIKREIRKSHIDQALGKQLMSAVKFLEGEKLNLAFNTISTNLEPLYPILPSVMQIAHKKLPDTDERTRSQFLDIIYELIERDSYIIQTDNNAAYVARVLSLFNSEKSIQGIQQLYSNLSSPLVRVNCIYSMINLRSHYWLSDLRTKFLTMSKFERRAFVAASYFLLDEGSHWREHTKHQFTDLELLIKDWVGGKNPVQSNWSLPL